MQLKLDNIQKLIVVGDRVLVKRTKSSERTKMGLILPPGVTEKEEIQSGYVVKVGPGYAVSQEDEENWKESDKKVKYIPLQAKEGDLAIYLQKQALEIEFEKERYFLVPNAAILLLYRDE